MPHLVRTLVAALACAGAAAAPVLAAAAAADGYPAKPIKIVVPFPPGGTTDTLARLVAPHMQQALGQPVVIENKGGAAATLGTDFVAKAAPDGHTLLVGAAHHTITQSVFAKLPYQFDTVTSALPHVKSGKTRALAVTTAKRSSALPEVPTPAGSGLAGLDVGTWFGRMAPAGTPAAIVDRLDAQVVAIVNDPAVRRQLLQQGIEPMTGTPAEMKAHIDREPKEFGSLARRARLTAE